MRLRWLKTVRLFALVSLCFLTTSFLATACTFDQPVNPKAPVVNSFLINGVEAQDNQGPIITFATTINLEAVATAQLSLERLTISGQKNGDAAQQLSQCTRSPCRFAWKLAAADNGVYSFIIEAEDTRGAISLVPFSNALAIEIR